MSATAVVLPELEWMPSPNWSERSPRHHPVSDRRPPPGRLVPRLGELALRPEGTGEVTCSPKGTAPGSTPATQLVAWGQEGRACASFNSASYNIEVDDNAWDGANRAPSRRGEDLRLICFRTGIPPVRSKDPLHDPGIVRHLDLGWPGGVTATRHRTSSSGTRSSSRWAGSSSAAASARSGAAARSR